jgi:hypothetical protein
MMGGTQLGFGTPTFNPAQSLTFGTPWATGSYGVQAPQQQLLHALQQLVQLDYIQQQQALQLVPQRLQLLQQIQQLIQVAGQQQHQPFQPYGSFPISSFTGQAGWLTGNQGVQPQLFGGHAGYVM